jgi:hypothetical protein
MQTHRVLLHQIISLNTRLTQRSKLFFFIIVRQNSTPHKTTSQQLYNTPKLTSNKIYILLDVFVATVGLTVGLLALEVGDDVPLLTTGFP